MPSSFPKVVLNNMDPVDFKTAMESPDKIGLAPYYNYAKATCNQLIKKYNINIPAKDGKEALIEDAIHKAMATLYAKIDAYDPEKGAAFSSYFYTGVRNSLSETLREYGFKKNHPIVRLNEDVATQMSPDSIHSYQETPAAFSEKQVPYVISFIKTLPDIKKRIIMAKFGIGFKADAGDSGEFEMYDSSYGYASELSEEFGKEGIAKTPGAIKTMANELLYQLRNYLVDRTGMSEREFHDNLRTFVLVDHEQEEKDAVRRKLITLDANSMSDNEAAWLLMLFLKN